MVWLGQSVGDAEFQHRVPVLRCPAVVAVQTDRGERYSDAQIEPHVGGAHHIAGDGGLRSHGQTQSQRNGDGRIGQQDIGAQTNHGNGSLRTLSQSSAISKVFNFRQLCVVLQSQLRTRSTGCRLHCHRWRRRNSIWIVSTCGSPQQFAVGWISPSIRPWSASVKPFLWTRCKRSIA